MARQPVSEPEQKRSRTFAAEFIDRSCTIWYAVALRSATQGRCCLAAFRLDVVSKNWDKTTKGKEAWPQPKPVVWVGGAKRDFDMFPRSVQRVMGEALLVAQYGGKAGCAKPLKGMGPGLLELVSDDAGDTYRAVYTVRLHGYVYVLHAFQKKSSRGIKTPKPDIDLVRQRLRDAQALHNQKMHGTQAGAERNGDE